MLQVWQTVGYVLATGEFTGSYGDPVKRLVRDFQLLGQGPLVSRLLCYLNHKSKFDPSLLATECLNFTSENDIFVVIICNFADFIKRQLQMGF